MRNPLIQFQFYNIHPTSISSCRHFIPPSALKHLGVIGGITESVRLLIRNKKEKKWKRKKKLLLVEFPSNDSVIILDVTNLPFVFTGESEPSSWLLSLPKILVYEQFNASSCFGAVHSPPWNWREVFAPRSWIFHPRANATTATIFSHYPGIYRKF